MTEISSLERPGGITALSWVFGAGAVISGVCAISLLWPGGLLEPMWRLNPRARLAFVSMAGAAPLLLGAVSLACGAAALGLWRGARWGYWLAVGLLGVNLLGDLLNTILGTEPRAAVGIPIVGLILALLATGRVRNYFRRNVPA